MILMGCKYAHHNQAISILPLSSSSHSSHGHHPVSTVGSKLDGLMQDNDLSYECFLVLFFSPLFILSRLLNNNKGCHFT